MKRTHTIIVGLSSVFLLGCPPKNTPSDPNPDTPKLPEVDDQDPDLDQDGPAMPTNVNTDRETSNDSVIVTWDGVAHTFEVQQSFLPANSDEWDDGQWVQKNGSGSTNSHTVNALPQPMRFRVRALDREGETSEPTDWERSDP